MQVTIHMEEPVTLTFALRYLGLFTKVRASQPGRTSTCVGWLFVSSSVTVHSASVPTGSRTVASKSIFALF